MAIPRNPHLRKVYEVMLALAADPNSELYWNGKQHRGASHRCAFWDAYNGVQTNLIPPGTMVSACHAAGLAWAKQNKP